MRFGRPVSASWVAWCRTVVEQPRLLQRRRRLVADAAQPGEHVAVQLVGASPAAQPAVATPEEGVAGQQRDGDHVGRAERREQRPQHRAARWSC